MRLVVAEQVVEDDAVDLVAGLGEPLVPHLVGEDAERAQEARARARARRAAGGTARPPPCRSSP